MIHRCRVGEPRSRHHRTRVVGFRRPSIEGRSVSRRKSMVKQTHGIKGRNLAIEVDAIDVMIKGKPNFERKSGLLRSGRGCRDHA